MKNQYIYQLKVLLKDYEVDPQIIAHKVGRQARTIKRWLDGETAPSFAEKKMLEQIFNGYKYFRNKIKK